MSRTIADAIVTSGFRLQHDRHRGRVVITLTEKATLAGWCSAVAALIDEDAWQHTVVYDMSAVESASLYLNLPNLVPTLSYLTAVYGRKGPVAAVVGSDESSQWRLRLQSLFKHLLVSNAFSDVEAAHHWLDQVDQRTGDA